MVYRRRRSAMDCMDKARGQQTEQDDHLCEERPHSAFLIHNSAGSTYNLENIRITNYPLETRPKSMMNKREREEGEEGIKPSNKKSNVGLFLLLVYRCSS